MRFLFLILALYCGAAQAQYTTKSANKAPTTYQQQAPAAQPVRPMAQPYARPAQQPTAVNSYTTQQQPAPVAQPTVVKSYTTQKRVTPQQQQQVVRPTAYRPVRPNAQVQEKADGEDDLPSFDAFKQKQQARSVATVPASGHAVQGANGQQERPLIIPKGEIWITRNGFEEHQIKMTGHKSCFWKIAIQNRTDTTIGRIRIEFNIGKDSNTYIIAGIKPGDYVRKDNESDGQCPAAEIRPNLKILSCKFGDVTGNKCAEYFVIK